MRIHVDRRPGRRRRSLAWPDGPEDEPPHWLVFGGMIRTVSMAEGEPGLRPLSTALEDEGFDDAGAGRAGRELRAPSDGAIDAWQEFGFSDGREELSVAARAAKRACAATSTTTAIFWCGASDKAERRAAARLLRRSPSRPGSIPRRADRSQRSA